ncbi:hypothetical protein WG947_07995 [Pontibacter sp. H259]|uniref:hypothetical protein n=1 Tax=Pontibacter sp. H259 TaxID=3133421 RepID=UPI0030C48079
MKFIAYISLLLLGYSIIINKAIKNYTLFNLPLIVFLFSVLFSIIPAYISWGQNPLTSFVSIVPYITYILYFYLLKKNVEDRSLENIVIFIGITTMLIYTTALLSLPNIIFGNIEYESIKIDRGFPRILIGGLGFIYLSYFITFTKFRDERELKFLLLSLVFFIGICLTLTRQIIFPCLVISFLILFKDSTLFKKVVFIIIGTIIFYFFLQLDFVQLLLIKTEQQTDDYESDLRVLAAEYYLFDFSPDLLTSIFGNGEAVIGKSSFGNKYEYIKSELKFYQSDVGLVGLYSKFGLFSVLSWILLFIRVFKSKYSPSGKYIKPFFLLLLVTSFTSSIIYHFNYIATVAIAIYLAEIKRIKQIR